MLGAGTVLSNDMPDDGTDEALKKAIFKLCEGQVFMDKSCLGCITSSLDGVKQSFCWGYVSYR